MKVLVTGHRGYVGTVLVPQLQAREHQVCGLDSDLYRGADFLQGPPEVAEYYCDIRDVRAEHLHNVDAVIHLAGLSNDPLGDLDPALTQAINHRAGVHLARLARDAGVQRILVASSCSVYGDGGLDWLDEDSPLRPLTPYAVSKLRLEEDISALADEHFSPVFLRAATVYGLAPRIRFDLVVNNLLAYALASAQVLLKSDGQSWRPLLHVADLAGVYTALLEAPKALIHNQVFNVGNTAFNHQVQELATLVAAATKATIIQRPGAGPDKRCYRVRCERLAQCLPQALPATPVAEALPDMVRVFRDAKLRVADFEGERYQRVARLKARLSHGQLGADLRWSSP